MQATCVSERPNLRKGPSLGDEEQVIYMCVRVCLCVRACACVRVCVWRSTPDSKGSAQITRTGKTVFFYRNKTIGSPGCLKFPTLASHYSIKVGCWARLP